MDYKELYSNYTKRLPFTSMRKWYDKDKDGVKIREFAEIQIDIYKSGVSIAIGKDLRTSRMVKENWYTIYSQIDNMYNVFTLCKQFIQNTTQSESMKIPIVRFRDFSEPWIKNQLSEVAEFSKGRGYSKKNLQFFLKMPFLFTSVPIF